MFHKVKNLKIQFERAKQKNSKDLSNSVCIITYSKCKPIGFFFLRNEFFWTQNKEHSLAFIWVNENVESLNNCFPIMENHPGMS